MVHDEEALAESSVRIRHSNTRKLNVQVNQAVGSKRTLFTSIVTHDGEALAKLVGVLTNATSENAMSK